MILTCPNSPMLIPKFVKLSWHSGNESKGRNTLKNDSFCFSFFLSSFYWIIQLMASNYNKSSENCGYDYVSFKL